MTDAARSALAERLGKAQARYQRAMQGQKGEKAAIERQLARAELELAEDLAREALQRDGA